MLSSSERLKMSCRVFIENPPPFKPGRRNDRAKLGDRPIADELMDGLMMARCYLSADIPIAGLHHSDLDRFEARQIWGEERPVRHDSFEYARTLKGALAGFSGLLIPHRVTIYEIPQSQEPDFCRLIQAGIKDIVLVGRPFSLPPAGAVYRSTVEEGLAYLRTQAGTLELNLGAVGIPSRPGEAERIARKFEAAGGRLRIMGQFLDDAVTMTSFMDQLARLFETKGLDLGRLEWNVGLAILALKNRTFYAKLLRKDVLACEARFAACGSMEQRITASIEMNLEFAQRVKEHGAKRGIDIGFSVQSVIERGPGGTIHPAAYGAIELARRLGRMVA
jgi:hypothetical protein